VHAVNSALGAGARLEDLVGSPVALVTPLPPPGSGDGGVPSPREAFLAFLAAHGQRPDDRWRADARVFPKLREQQGVSVQVDYAVQHPALAVPWLVESFAGVADTWGDAIRQTIVKLERASLHPLIAGLLDPGACADQVEWDELAHPDGRFRVCLGPELALLAPEPPAHLGAILQPIKAALAAAPLSRKVHACRIYLCRNADELCACEVLLDNRDWPAGQAVLSAHPWPSHDGYWALRLFFLLVPDP
jgi:hypothetical protein